MNKFKNIITAAFLIALIPFSIASGQEKKSEQKIKIVIADDGGSKVILDTLITGEPLSDSIVLRNGNTIYLAHDDSDNAPGAPECKKYIITTTESDGNDNKKQINKKITVISSDSDMSEMKGNGKSDQMTWVSAGDKNYSYTVESDNKNSESTKYVINRDGVRITVEGSDYDRVKELTKEIEKTLDTKGEAK
jgi:hypothetical protein